MKHLRIAALVMSAMLPLAALSQVVITPDVATAGTQFIGSIGADGEIYACVPKAKIGEAKRYGDCTLAGTPFEANLGYYVPIRSIVPAGKTYVGFGVGGWLREWRLYYVFWK